MIISLVMLHALSNKENTKRNSINFLLLLYVKIVVIGQRETGRIMNTMKRIREWNELMTPFTSKYLKIIRK